MTSVRKNVHSGARAFSPRRRAVIDLARVGNGGLAIGFVVSAAIIVAAIAIVTAIVAGTGGAPNPLVHLYYLPILYAAARHGRWGGLLASGAAGLAAGPWMPAPGTASGHQSVGDWTVRIVLFAVVALVAAWLARQHPQPLDLLLRDVVLGQGLRAAVRQHRLRVHYQPLVDLADGRVLGVEALCRWDDNRGRPVSPAMFIPAAERTGAISLVGKEVLRLSTEQSLQWAATQGDALTMSVNVSPLQLCHPDFLRTLSALAGDAKTRRFQLCVEITETAIINDPDKALMTLSALRAMGAQIAIDDFGTGQSSLSYLAGLPLDIIKIDQAFVAAVDVDPTARALVSAVVHIAAALGAKTIAEGIERPEQLRVLRELGCDIGQGYYLGRPTPPAEVDWAVRKLT